MSTKLIIVHGWSYSLEKWQPFEELLKASGFEPVSLPIPGLTATTDKVWTLDEYVEWLKTTVAKHRGPQLFLGHSNGGRILLKFAHTYPDLVKKLILIDSAGIYPKGLKIRLKRAVFKTLATVGKKLTASPTLRNLLYKLAREKDYQEASPLMRQTMANLISVDLTPLLPEITTPTLLIWGKDDRATPLSDAQLMSRTLPTSQLIVIEGARHSPQFTHPDKVMAAINQHLNQI